MIIQLLICALISLVIAAGAAALDLSKARQRKAFKQTS